MRFRSFSYYMGEAVISLIRNRLMALASIITVLSCIFIVSFSYCMAVNVDYILEQMESSLNLSVYITDDLDAESVPNLADKIKAIPNVKNVQYISAEEALEKFKTDLGEDDQRILEGLEDDNPLPRSFVISLDDINNQQNVITELESLRYAGISDVKYDQKIIDTITSLNTGIRIASLIIIVCLVVVSVVIIINTIKITVNNRRVEISIMKYIGATDWFIRWPFIIEGVLIGVIGAVIPVLMCWLGYAGAIQAIYDKVVVLQNLIEFKSAPSVFLVLLPLSLTIGVGIGIVGSVTSLHKYLKV